MHEQWGGDYYIGKTQRKDVSFVHVCNIAFVHTKKKRSR